MKRMILLFLILSGYNMLSATECTLSGTLVFGSEAQPVGNYQVELAFFQQEIYFSDTTNADGKFFFSFELDFDGPNPIFGNVIVTDFCSGVVLIEPVIFLAEFPDNEDVLITVCDDSNPPPPPYSCEPYFQFQQAAADPYIVKFFDISSTTAPVDTWLWDFGDGAFSNMQNPSYEYEEAGEYEVSLTIQADTCENIYTRWVSVTDSVPCNCNGIFSPVCVLTIEGDTIPFLNSCFAECEGYTEEQYFSCIDACEANFEAEPTGLPGQMKFFDMSEVIGGTITDWLWDFGDGGQSTEQNPVHTFSEAGMQAVSLQITTTNSCYSNLNQPVLVSTVSSNSDKAINIFELSTFPNPAKNFIVVKLTPVNSGQYQFQIRSMEGRLMKEAAYYLPAGSEQQIEFSLSNFPPGMYMIQVQDGKNIHSLRLIRQ